MEILEESIQYQIQVLIPKIQNGIIQDKLNDIN